MQIEFWAFKSLVRFNSLSKWKRKILFNKTGSTCILLQKVLGLLLYFCLYTVEKWQAFKPLSASVLSFFSIGFVRRNSSHRTVHLFWRSRFGYSLILYWSLGVRDLSFYLLPIAYISLSWNLNYYFNLDD